MTEIERPWSPRACAVKPMASDRFRLFGLRGTEALGEAVARVLGCRLTAHEEREFEDGEHKARPLDPVQGADVYVLHSLYGGPEHSANDKLCRLLFFIGALKDAGAERVTAVAPYLCYARKDRRTKVSDPVTTRYLAGMFEAVGTDAVVTLEVHNPAAFENAFRCRTVALPAAPLFVDYVRELGGGPLCVVSPDTGGAKRAELLRQALETVSGQAVGKAFAEKYRSAGVVSGDLFVGDVAGTTALLVDDLLSTGTTLRRTALAARDAGALRVIALVAHGLFMAGSEALLSEPAIDRVVITDSVPPFRLGHGHGREKLVVVPAAPLLAEAIRRLHQGHGLADLLAF